MNFKNIWIDAEVETSNEYYTIFHHSSTPFMYDSNFLSLHVVPTLEMFELIEEHLVDFHLKKGLTHLKFTWPENKGLTPPVVSYLEKEGYGLEMLELYAIDPSMFTSSKTNKEVVLTFVTEENLDTFKEISYEQDAEISLSFATDKERTYNEQFKNSNVHFVLATIGEEAVGGVTLIETNETVEIDSLFVREKWQKQGVGTSIQQFVMDYAKEKHVLLVADASDTPKEMYVKQGYIYQGFQISALKEY